MSITRRFSIFLFLILTLKIADAQQIPLNPLSYRIFSPFVFNPAVAGSKDFLSIDLISSSRGNSNSQILSISTRLTRKSPGYLSSPDAKEFTGTGTGGFIYNDMSGKYRNIGGGATFSYHITLDKQHLRFLSVGVTLKGVYSMYSGDTDLAIPSGNTFYPDTDLGLYYYGPSFFAGASVTNLRGNPNGSDTIVAGGLPLSRQYFFYTGYKIVISRQFNIVVEPSVIVNTDNFSALKASDIIEPVLKLYMENICLGTYINDFKKYSFFFQYKFPKIYVGTFFQLPRNTPYFKSDLMAEFTVGFNFSRNSEHNHW